MQHHHDLKSMTDLLKEMLAQEKQQNPSAFQGFIEAGDKFKDAATYLGNYVNHLLTDTQKKLIETHQLKNTSILAGISPDILHAANKLSLENGSRSNDANSNLVKHLIDLHDKNPKKPGQFKGDDLFQDDPLQKEVFADLQNKFNVSPAGQNKLLETLNLGKKNLGAFFLNQENPPFPEILEQYRDIAPSNGEQKDSHDRLKKSVPLKASPDKTHLNALTFPASRLENITNALIKIGNAHPERIAEKLSNYHAALLLALSQNVTGTDIGLTSTFGKFTGASAPIIKSTENAEETDLNIAKTAGHGTLTSGRSARLTQEIPIPATARAESSDLWKWWQHRQQRSKKPQTSPDIARLTEQADQEQIFKIQNFQQQSAYFKNLSNSHPPKNPQTPSGIQINNLNITTQEDNPRAIAEAVETGLRDMLIHVNAGLSPLH